MSSITIKYGPLRKLLCDGGASVLDTLHAITDHIDSEDASNPAIELLKSASAAYMEHANRAKQPETRTIEYYRIWEGGLWDTDYIEIPYNTNEEGVAEAVQIAANAIEWEDETPVLVGVYNTPEDEDYVVSDTCTGCMGPLDSDGNCPNQSCSS